MSSTYLSSSLFHSPLHETPQRPIFKQFDVGIRCAFAAPGRKKFTPRTSSAGPKKRIWKKGEFPGTGSSETKFTDRNRRTPLQLREGRNPPPPPSSDEPKRRLWKKGEFPGTGSSETKFTDRNRRTPLQLREGRNPPPPPSSDEPKRRLWKKGEFPGVSETMFNESNGRTPLKNVKKKLERKANATAWVETVTEALSDRIAKRQWLQALEVFEMLKEQPFYQPKEGTYMKLLILLGRSGQPDHARQLFDEMIEAGIGPTPELYTALLAAYCRNNLIDEAFSVLTHMKSLPDCQPDVFTYSTLIKACVDASRFDLVESLFKEMAERSIMPNTVTQNTVLSGYGRVGKFHEMETVLSGMLETKDCKPDVWTMNIILSVFGNNGQIDVMERWYEKFRNFGIEPETRTFNIMIGAYGKKRMYDKMSSVMEYMRKLQFPWTTSTYNNVIEAFSDVGDAQNMEYTFDQMRAENMRADTKTFCCLINGYANAGLFHKVVATVKLAGRFEIPENTSFFNSIILACAKADDLIEMERVFQKMKDQQCPPNSATYSVMIEAYKKVGMNDKVFDLEQEREQNPMISSDAELSTTGMEESLVET